MPIAEMMQSWTTQMGYPVLTVSDFKEAGGKATVSVKQEWFLADGSEVSAADAKLWCVPILTSTKGGISDDVSMMREDTMAVTVDLAGGDWFKFNADQQVSASAKRARERSERGSEA
jgi:aminopeptidase N